MLLAGVAIVAVVAAVIVFTALKGSSSTPVVSAPVAKVRVHHPHSAPPPVAPSPGETRVTVLNGTTTTGLAHRLSATLQQTGYSQSTPLDGTPPGSYPTTVVEYATGDHAAAAKVAQALGVSQVQVLESSISALAGDAQVVVIAGLDKAGSSTPSEGGGEASSGSTP